MPCSNFYHTSLQLDLFMEQIKSRCMDVPSLVKVFLGSNSLHSSVFHHVVADLEKCMCLLLN